MGKERFMKMKIFLNLKENFKMEIKLKELPLRILLKNMMVNLKMINIMDMEKYLNYIMRKKIIYIIKVISKIMKYMEKE